MNININTHTSFSYFSVISLTIITVIFSFFLGDVNTKAEEIKETNHKTIKSFETQDFNLSNAGGYFQKATSTTLTAKNNKTVYWSFFHNNPSNLHSTTEVARIFIPQKRNLYVFSDTSTIEKFTFHIKKFVENRFFRIHSIDSNPQENFLPTITVENASPYPFEFSMKGWKISGNNFSITLPNEALEPGEKRTFIADVQNSQIGETSEVLLTSPTNRVRDRIQVPHLQKTETYSREQLTLITKNQKITRPKFLITSKK